MSSVSNINFPCIVKLGQLNKKTIKIEYVLKEKCTYEVFQWKESRSKNIHDFHKSKIVLFLFTTEEDWCLEVNLYVSRNGKITPWSFYIPFIVCSQHAIFQQGIKIYNEEYSQIVPLSVICNGQLLLLPSGWTIEHVIIFWVGLKKPNILPHDVRPNIKE